MKKTYCISALMASVLLLTGCRDEDFKVDNSQTQSDVQQNGINFNIGVEAPDDQTRTQYTKQDWLQLEWEISDTILIACAETQAPKTWINPARDKGTAAWYNDSNWETYTQARYRLTNIYDKTYPVKLENGNTVNVTTKSNAHITCADTRELYWGPNNSKGQPKEHTFYAACGKNVESLTTGGKVKIKYNPEQFAVVGNDGAWIDKSQINMVCYKKTYPVDDVDLHFKTIMTTVEVIVQGPDNGYAIVNAVEITTPKTQDKIYVEYKGKKINNTWNHAWQTYFDCQIQTDGTGIAPLDPNKQIQAGNQTFQFGLFKEKVVVNLTGSAASRTIYAGQTMRIVALLPPVLIDKDNAITIAVDAMDGTRSTTFGTNKQNYSTSTKTEIVSNSGKAVIKLGKWVAPARTVHEVNNPTQLNGWAARDCYVDMTVNNNGAGKWAVCNVGATSPEEYGDYFGWGSVIPYATSSVVTWPLYFKKIWGTGTQQSDCGNATYDPLYDHADKYSGNYQNQNKDYHIWKGEHDAAYVRLGKDWCTPNEATWEKLCAGWQTNNSGDKYWNGDIAYTTYYKWTKGYYLNGVEGIKIEQRNNGNKWIFIPYAGGYDDGDAWHYGTSSGTWYWSSTYFSYKQANAHGNTQDYQNSISASAIDFTSGKCGWGNYFRYHGRPIRPVLTSSVN